MIDFNAFFILQIILHKLKFFWLYCYKFIILLDITEYIKFRRTLQNFFLIFNLIADKLHFSDGVVYRD